MADSPDYKMDFFVKDFLSSTLLMTGEQQAVYALTLVVAWTQGATLPADPETIRVALRIDADAWKRIWPVLAPKWPLAADGSHRENPRQREEWETAYDRAEAYSRASEVANRARWGVRSRSEPDSDRKRTGVRTGIRTGIRTGVRIGLRSESPSPSPSSPSLIPSGEVISEESVRRASRARRTPFVPPTIEEVAAYIREKCYRIDAKAFVAHYTANGWVQGKARAPIKDWKAAVVTWVRADPENRAPLAEIEAERERAAAERREDEHKRREAERLKREREGLRV